MPDTDPPAERASASSASAGQGQNRCTSLLTRVQRGDEGAFEELYRQQGTIMMAVILRVVRNRSLAEEVLQEVFTEVWTKRSRFDASAGSAQAWLTTMCRRRAIDRVRAVHAQQERDFTEGVKEVHQAPRDVQAEAVDHVESARAATALGVLPVEQATAIVLAYYKDLSHAEIAAELSVPLGTVKSRIRDGMARLRAHLGVADER